MKLVIATLFAATIGFSASANEDWKTEALAEIVTLQDVTEGQWAESGALWLATDKEKRFLPVYTEQVVCAQAYFAKKPKGEELQITWFSAEAIARNKLERVTTIFCKW